MQWLARRDYSRYELEQRLQRKKIDPSLIENVMTVLLEEGWVNDVRYTENFIYFRRNLGYGPERISQELQIRGIAETIIEAAIDKKSPAWIQSAVKLWEKHFKYLPKTPQDWLKQARFFSTRGYSEEFIESWIKRPD